MRFLKVIRYAEWWEYKLIPLFTIGYAVILHYEFSLETSIYPLLGTVLSIVCGAIYVSIINDITDLEDDRKAGKSNNMQHLTKTVKVLLVSICLAAALCFSAFFFYPDSLSIIYYVLAYVAFSLYSIPPARLKNRKFWGVICDASGAHLLPTLLILSHLLYQFHVEVQPFIALVIGGWAFTYGMRGILWHQFQDRDNDIKSGTITFASKVDPMSFKSRELLIFMVEMSLLSAWLLTLWNTWILLSLLAYLLLVIARKVVFKYAVSLIITPKNAPYQLLMNDFYLVFLPIAYLIPLSIQDKYGWVILGFHLLMFPVRIWAVVKDFYLLLRKIIG